MRRGAKTARFRAAHYLTGEVMEFTTERGRVARSKPVRGKSDLIFGPGFFDLQCNGYAGIDFNNPEATPEELAQGIQAMAAQGCTHVLPTVITAEADRLEHLFRQLVAALALDKEVARMVPGFHLEGPFISPVEGARGAHPEQAICSPNRRLWTRLQRAAEGRIRLVTLAPEIRGAIPFTEFLRTEEVLPAIGHTMADVQAVADAASAGALLSTHLGNGCPQMLHRHQNPITAQLGEDRLAATVIPDGIHLPPEVVRTYARTKGPARTLLVTDAMSAAGAPPGRYRLADLELEVGADRVVRFPGAANFAGSALTMDRGVALFQQMTGCGWGEAWDAASELPWMLLREAWPKAPRAKRDLIFARVEEGALKVVNPAELA